MDNLVRYNHHHHHYYYYPLVIVSLLILNTDRLLLNLINASLIAGEQRGWQEKNRTEKKRQENEKDNFSKLWKCQI